MCGINPLGSTPASTNPITSTPAVTQSADGIAAGDIAAAVDAGGPVDFSDSFGALTGALTALRQAVAAIGSLGGGATAAPAPELALPATPPKLTSRSTVPVRQHPSSAGLAHPDRDARPPAAGRGDTDGTAKRSKVTRDRAGEHRHHSTRADHAPKHAAGDAAGVTIETSDTTGSDGPAGPTAQEQRIAADRAAITRLEGLASKQLAAYQRADRQVKSLQAELSTVEVVNEPARVSELSSQITAATNRRTGAGLPLQATQTELANARARLATDQGA